MPASTARICGCAGLLLLVCAYPVRADNEDAIARCSTIADRDEHIRCLEDALRGPGGESPASDAPTEQVPGSKVAPEPGPESGVAQPAPVPAAKHPASQRDDGTRHAQQEAASGAKRVTVTDVRLRHGTQLVFRTNDGAVWVQVDRRTARYDTPFEAEIEPAALGSYVLKPITGGISVRVRRER